MWNNELKWVIHIDIALKSLAQLADFPNTADLLQNTGKLLNKWEHGQEISSDFLASKFCGKAVKN